MRDQVRAAHGEEHSELRAEREADDRDRAVLAVLERFHERFDGPFVRLIVCVRAAVVPWQVRDKESVSGAHLLDQWSPHPPGDSTSMEQ
ncbi:hypothetical protein GCM10017576_06590 [Microbacterium barkeri]|uniref:Uncharacterized protein n=1 Tax=Microbacterium barkeri TaxID=33917 RepID=A0A9W6H1K8_9MICO|nr:hypothetical protein GCM10017576_06590 [Microbacterium barkeri]